MKYCDFCGNQAPETWVVCCLGGLEICFICSIRNQHFNQTLTCELCRRQLGHYLFNSLKIRIQEYYRYNTFPSPSRLQFAQRPQLPYHFYGNSPYVNNFRREQFYPQESINCQQSYRGNKSINRYENNRYENNVDIKNISSVGNFVNSGVAGDSRNIVVNEQSNNFDDRNQDLQIFLCHRLKNEKSNKFIQEQQNQVPLDQPPVNKYKTQGEYINKPINQQHRDHSPQFSFGQCHSPCKNNKIPEQFDQPTSLKRSNSSKIQFPLRKTMID